LGLFVFVVIFRMVGRHAATEGDGAQLLMLSHAEMSLEARNNHDT